MKALMSALLFALFFGFSLTSAMELNRSCEAELLSPVANYQQLLQLGLENRDISLVSLQNVNEGGLNPLRSGLTANQKVLKSAIDRVLLKFGPQEKSQALTIIQKLTGETSQRHKEKSRAAEDVARTVRPRLLLESQRSATSELSFYEFQSHSLPDGGSVVAAINVYDFSGFLLDSRSPNQAREIPPLRTSGSRHTRSFLKARSDEFAFLSRANQFVFSWIDVRQQKVHLYDFLTQEKATFAMDEVTDRIQLKQSPTGDTFLLASSSQSTTVYKVTDLTLTKISRFPTEGLKQLVFLPSGEPRLIAVHPDFGIEIHDVNSGSVINRWPLEKFLTFGNRFVAALWPHVTSTGEILIAVEIGGTPSGEESQLRFFRQSDPSGFTYLDVDSNPVVVKWLEASDGDLSLIVQRKVEPPKEDRLKAEWMHFKPFQISLTQPTIRQYVKQRWRRIPKAGRPVDLENMSSTYTSFYADKKNVWVDSNSEQITIVSWTSSRAAVSSFDLQSQIFTKTYERDLDLMYGGAHAFFDQASQDFHLVGSDFKEALRVYRLSDSGPLEVFTDGPSTFKQISPIFDLQKDRPAFATTTTTLDDVTNFRVYELMGER